nr:Uncharacterised protein [Streptococcus thermophilus]
MFSESVSLLAQTYSEYGTAQPEIPEGLLIGLGIASLISFIIWFWAVIDFARTKPMDGTSRVIWLVALLIGGIIAALVWLLWGRKNKDKWRANDTAQGAPGAPAQPGAPVNQRY